METPMDILRTRPIAQHRTTDVTCTNVLTHSMSYRVIDVTFTNVLTHSMSYSVIDVTFRYKHVVAECTVCPSSNFLKNSVLTSKQSTHQQSQKTDLSKQRDNVKLETPTNNPRVSYLINSFIMEAAAGGKGAIASPPIRSPSSSALAEEDPPGPPSLVAGQVTTMAP